MKIFLKEDVKTLGKMGDVVNVADGYARNYLFPKKLAVDANTRNIKEFEHHKKAILEKAVKIRDAAKLTADKLSSVILTIRAKAGEEDKLFGSVTTMDIAEALKAEGYDVDRKKISLEEPIKRLGSYTVDVKVHSDVAASIKVNVIQE
ncbi:MAG: 50S ribosomal protein L9 [Nitrospiraceae bacterium]|nr:50S ribosomal protein L9 [Nitrospiraceae bacterium]